MKIKIYGCRGTIPLFSRDNIKYGGNTSCMKVETGGRTVIIDCGSGLVQFYKECRLPLNLDILIGHLHIDHIIGLSAFPPLWDRKNDIRIYTKSRDGRPIASQVFEIFKPPYWPVDLEKASCAEFIGVKEDEPFMLGGDIKITPFAANHSDGTTAFRIDAASGKSLVHLLDHGTEKNTVKYDGLVRYCENADIIIYDSAYLPEDYADRQDWGHSIYSDGIALAEKSNCRQMIFCHFDQQYSDGVLDMLSQKISEINGADKKYLLSFDGMELGV